MNNIKTFKKNSIEHRYKDYQQELNQNNQTTNIVNPVFLLNDQFKVKKAPKMRSSAGEMRTQLHKEKIIREQIRPSVCLNTKGPSFFESPFINYLSSPFQELSSTYSQYELEYKKLLHQFKLMQQKYKEDILEKEQFNRKLKMQLKKVKGKRMEKQKWIKTWAEKFKLLKQQIKIDSTFHSQQLQIPSEDSLQMLNPKLSLKSQLLSKKQLMQKNLSQDYTIIKNMNKKKKKMQHK